MNLYTRVNFGLLALASKAQAISGAPTQYRTDPTTVAEQLSWLDGTGADKANQAFQYVGSIVASGADTFDLTSGQVDAFGDALSMARVKAVYLKNLSAAGGANITIGGTTGILGSGLVLRPQESVLKAVGDATAWAVVNGSSDSLTITNASASAAASYRLVLVGEAA